MAVYARIHTADGSYVAVADEPMTTDEWVREVTGRIDAGELIHCAQMDSDGNPRRGADGFFDTHPCMFRRPETIHMVSGHVL